MPNDVSITINEGESFAMPISLKDENGTALPLATTVTVNGMIKSDFGGSATTYATFDTGAIDRTNSIIGVALLAADASTYVQAAEAASAFTNSTTRTAQYGLFDINIDEQEAGLAVTAGSQANKTLTISGNYQRLSDGGSIITVSGSTGNDGTYSSVGSIYDSGANTTTITLQESLPSATMDGNIQLDRTTRIAQGQSFASREVTT